MYVCFQKMNLMKLTIHPWMSFLGRLCKYILTMPIDGKYGCERFKYFEARAVTCLMSKDYVQKFSAIYATVETDVKEHRGELLADYLNVSGKAPNAILVIGTDKDRLVDVVNRITHQE